MAKWRPSKAQQEAYNANLKVRDTLPIIAPNNAIRTNCYIEYYSLNRGEIIRGTVIKHSYGKDKNQHTFTIKKEDGNLLFVKGRNLYPNLLKHIPGQESLTKQMKLL
jgi:hypothetical protein